ncbi:unnamed protein product [Penicillium salamii]|uniref:Uncharacterized protein n=1 Tax=Penicillium salamii TaxID=1612424 RepID=A0A9W4IYX1_9EURO|nr:unnamed protein product [Penicillium salamii]CAG8219788.1 unnamed protein product [Penicillium salamii]CAG8324806.1 unnamed protein product [Penicillium salamii]CAG8360516.1 unnamed protein product [Penicillium salamii]CAG8360999.1 unnamed protein product [Penicillium salamii]
MPPFLHGKDPGRAWQWLALFWGTQKVQAWRDLLMRDSVINAHQIYNLLTVALDVRNYLDCGLAALRPVSVNEDETEMRIALHWLPLPKEFGEMTRTDLVPLTQNPLEEPRFRPTMTHGNNHPVYIVYGGGRTWEAVRSGHIFTVKTTNVEERPLPSFQLLELMWFLTRIATMEGKSHQENGFPPSQSS